MSPSISGVVYNQTTGVSRTQKTLDIRPILERRPDLFRVGFDKVNYVWPCPDVSAGMFATQEERKAAAERRLRLLLVEGVFIYFFAKFCHGPRFPIKVSFYQRSEPVRSVLQLVTGEADVAEAIGAFFDTFNQIFVFDRKVCVILNTRLKLFIQLCTFSGERPLADC